MYTRCTVNTGVPAGHAEVAVMVAVGVEILVAVAGGVSVRVSVAVGKSVTIKVSVGVMVKVGAHAQVMVIVGVDVAVPDGIVGVKDGVQVGSGGGHTSIMFQITAS